MADDATLDHVTRRLAEIQDALLALDDDAPGERHRLLTERDGLRARAGVFRRDADMDRSDDDLAAELASLRLRRIKMMSLRTGFATSKGGSNHGPASAAWVRLGAEARGGSDLEKINVRIARLEEVLDRRSGGA
ncbi:MAG: hypothetical protein ACE5GC_06245 [Acidimicrobiia bacterium]